MLRQTRCTTTDSFPLLVGAVEGAELCEAQRTGKYRANKQIGE